MRHLALRLLIALLTLGIGITADLVWRAFNPAPVEVVSPDEQLTLITPQRGVGCGRFDNDVPPPPPAWSVSSKTVLAGGVLNSKAISLPQPTYPPIAKAARAQGSVTVQVVADEEGSVISAQAVSGHPLLQQAAVAAARQAKISPTLVAGRPVKVSGVLIYTFVLQ